MDEHLKNAYKTWMNTLYTTVNPNTGLAIKDDPTVAILQIHNEDSLLFWTQQNLKTPHVNMLLDRWNTWLTARYGSLNNAYAAWSGYTTNSDQNYPADANNRVSMHTIWHLTQDWTGGKAARIADETEFLTTLMRDFYQEMNDYLVDDIGCKQLINASNWKNQ